MKKLTAQQRQKAKRIIEQIARQEGKTVEYVRSQMALAIREGWKNAQDDPDVIRMMEKPNKKEPLS